MLISRQAIVIWHTQEIHIRVQDVSIDKFGIRWKIRLFFQEIVNTNKKSQTLYFSNQKYRNYPQFNGRHATFFF